MGYDLPEFAPFRAPTQTVKDATLQFKRERRLSDWDDDISCPVQCVNLNSVTLVPNSSDNTDRTVSFIEGFTEASRKEMEILSDDAVYVSKSLSLPCTRKFQLWQGDLVRFSPWKEIFVPASKDDSIIRQDWLQMEASPESPGTAELSRHQHNGGEALAVRNTIRRARAIQHSGSAGMLAPFGSHNELRYDGMVVTLGCSLLIPHNFSAYGSTRAPVIFLSETVEMSDSSVTYRGPIRWSRPDSSQHPRKKHFMSVDRSLT